MHKVPKDAETHFKLVIVSDRFFGLTPVGRQRLVYQYLHAELSSGLHAVSLHTYTLREWQQLNNVPASPACAQQVKDL